MLNKQITQLKKRFRSLIRFLKIKWTHLIKGQRIVNIWKARLNLVKRSWYRGMVNHIWKRLKFTRIDSKCLKNWMMIKQEHTPWLRIQVIQVLQSQSKRIFLVITQSCRKINLSCLQIRKKLLNISPFKTHLSIKV